MATAPSDSPLRIDLSLCSAQTESFRALKPGNRVCNAWGRGVGKSWFARVCMYLAVAQWEYVIRQTLKGSISGIRIVLLMPTMVQFSKVHERLLCEELEPKGPFGFLGAKINRSTWEIRFPGGSSIQVVGAHVIDSNRGIRCDMAVADEADDIEIGAYESVCIPWFSEPHTLDIRLISGTPRRGRFGLLWRAYRIWPHGDADHEPVANYFSFHATYRDAPEIVRPALVEEARKTTSPDRFSREWECNFDSGEGLVYPFFDLDFHVRTPPSLGAFHTFIVGMDHGFRDPTVMLVVGIAGSGRDTVCHVLQERYLYEQSITQLVEHAKQIEALFPDAKWYADHDPAKNQALRSKPNDGGAGVRLYEADKGAGSVEAGVSFVADALFVREDSDGNRWAQLYVDPRCKQMVQEFGLYRRKRDPRDHERVLDDIDSSKNDHCCDALRMALYSHFGGVDRRLVIG